MRITADTNILISAMFWSGDSGRIIEKAGNKEIQLILSKEILKEFAGVLAYKEIQDKIRGKNLEMKRTIEKIISISEIVEPKQKIDIVKEDPDDNKILECAIEGKAECILTKDNHLLKIREYAGIRILTPLEFLKILKG
jgi:putative PIN family toxin of toxin-antitoxin system